MAKPIYILFGESACRIYRQYGIAKTLHILHEHNFAIFYFDGKNIENLLEMSTYWDGYAIISKNDYQQILECN